MALKSNKLKVKPPTDTTETKKTSAKQKAKKSKSTKKKIDSSGKSKSFFLDSRFQRSIGFLFLVIGIYLFLAITTFFVNWFSAETSGTIAVSAEQFKDHTETVTNWTGWLGSYIAKHLIYNGIGIGSYFFSLVFISLGLKLLVKVKMFSLWRWFQLLIISFLWIPITSNLLFSSHPENLFGGIAGHQLNIWLQAYLGKAGIILLVIFIPVLFSIIDFKFQYNFSFLRKKKSKSTNVDNDVVNTSVTSSESIYNTEEFTVDENANDGFEIVKPETGTGNTFKVEEEKAVEQSRNKIKDDKLEDANELKLTVEVSKTHEVESKEPKLGEHFGVDTEFDPTLDLADYKLPPFDLDSLSDSDFSAIQFAGTFYSNGWFPEFAEKLHIMSDYSLGFEHSIPPEGYQLFGGNGRLFNRLSLDKRGLVGNGKLEFLTTILESEAFIFYPDSVAGSGFQYEMRNEEFNGVVFPQASAATYHMQWLPKKDSMYIQNIGEPFRLYNGDGTLDGSLIVTNKGVKGSGTLLTHNSETLSTNYSLSGESYKARHSRFKINSSNPEKPAFFGYNVRVSFDLPSKKADINPEVAGDAAIEFPYAQFNTSITRAVWDLEGQKVFMTKPENVPIEDSYFYTTRKDLDSLAFNATAAEYDMLSLELKVSGIPYIIVADSKITPENGEVLILEDARIGTLINTNIVLDTLNEFHEVYDATVTVISRNEFEGDGTYRFINTEEDTFAIQLSNFHLEEFAEGKRGKTAKHTVANGTIVEEDQLVISPGMYYRGNVKMLAHKPALELEGFVKLDLKSIPDYDTWIEYTSSAEQEQVVFKFDESLTSQGKLLSAGLHFRYGDFSLYSTFCYDKEDDQDEDFFKPSGFLSFKADSNEFVIVNRDKDLGLSYSGKVFGYDEVTRNIRFEGPVRFIDNSKTRAIKASAIGLGNMATNELAFTSFMTLNFKIPSTLFDMMGDDFKNVVEEIGAPEAIEDRTELLYLLAEIIGNRATKAYEEKSSLEYVPLGSMSPNLVRPMVFSNVKFKWSEDQKAFYNDGFVGLSNVLRTDLNAQFESFFEIRKTEAGETINLFIKASPDSWYYYSMEEDKLLMYSSNEAFNAFVTSKSNMGKAKIGEFQFGPADLPETLQFINTFRAIYFDIDEDYNLSDPTAIDDKPIESLGEEKPTDDDDGFGDDEDDDGF
ncbi:MAG: DNA translocase FtsK 4TM domain-containing protein [Cyclobacteriaceae bacterium]|nr:DNA translocase FtsK 4TM domain-containing protein [Cyclobacteriaceae bacterium]